MNGPKCRITGSISVALITALISPSFPSVPRRRRRAFLLRPAELHDPDPGVDVVEEDQTFVLPRPPGEGKVWAEAVRRSGPDAGDLAPLPVEVAAQLARDVEHPPAAPVVAHDQHVVLDPDVVCPALGHL